MKTSSISYYHIYVILQTPVFAGKPTRMTGKHAVHSTDFLILYYIPVKVANVPFKTYFKTRFSNYVLSNVIK